MAFDFQHEMIDYCKSDVALLKAGCIKFQQVPMSLCRGVRNYATPDRTVEELYQGTKTKEEALRTLEGYLGERSCSL